MTDTTNDTQHPNEACVICGGHAGLETSPEGSACGICDIWVCDEHVDYAYMNELHKNAHAYGQEYEGVDPICTSCSAARSLPRNYPTPADQTGTVEVPEWVLLQSVRYALPRRSYAVNETAEHLIGIWTRLTKETRSIILRDISEEHALWARQNREHRSPIEERTWRDTFNKLVQLEDAMPPERRAHDQYRP